MKQRIITGVIAGAAFIALLVLGGAWFEWLVFALAVIGFDEYRRMNGLHLGSVATIAGFVGVALLTAPFSPLWDRPDIGSFVWLVLFVLLAITVFTKNEVTIDQAGLLLLGVLYIGYGFHYMAATRLLEPDGLFWTLLIFVCIWATDSGAYFAGMAFGRNKLWPAISPNKTVEGALGGLVLSVVVAVVFSYYRTDALSIPQAVVLGGAIGVVGQLGDLMQSAYKRVKGIKDSGTLLPGHGGVLDRTDSWIIVFPFLHIIALIPQ